MKKYKRNGNVNTKIKKDVNVKIGNVNTGKENVNARIGHDVFINRINRSWFGYMGTEMS